MSSQTTTLVLPTRRARIKATTLSTESHTPDRDLIVTLISAMCPQTRSLLFRLPRELRDQVYTAYTDAEMYDSNFWAFSKNYEYCLANGRYHASDLPSLLYTCKRTYHEFAPYVVGLLCIWAPPRTSWSQRIGMGAFRRAPSMGAVSLGRMRKCVLRVDDARTAGEMAGFFKLVVSDEARRESPWFKGHDVDREAQEGRGAASKLQELVIEWSPAGGCKYPRTNPDLVEWYQGTEKKFLDQVAGLGLLRIVRLRGSYPDWWSAYLAEKTRSTVRVICE